MATWKHSFFTKLFLGNLLLIGLLLTVDGLVSYNEIDRASQEMSRLEQQRTVSLLVNCMEYLWPQTGGRLEEIDPICKRLLADSTMRLTVIDVSGKVLGDSENDPRKMERHDTPNRAEVTEAMQGRPGSVERYSDTMGIRFRYMAGPIYSGGRIVGVARVAMPVKDIAAETTLIRKGLLLAGAAAAGGAILLALLLSWIWYAPLRQITRTAKALAAGDLTHRAPVAGADELGQLASSLNEMRDSIAGQISQIAAQRQNLLSLLENLREGVVGLDAEGRILLVNQAAIDLLAGLPKGPVIEQHLQNVIRAPEVVEAYNTAVQTGLSVNRQIEVIRSGRRLMLDLHARRLSPADTGQIAGIVVVRDVTDIARSAAMKAEFVANASHELRTPLATIRAAVDSLAYCGADDPEAFAKCVEIINRHVLRLEDMTNDLLDLNIAETGRARMRLEDVTVASLAEWVKSHFAAKAAEKKIDLTTSADDGDRTFRTDRRLMELIIQNLAENAIKYTPDGGNVRVQFHAAEGGGELTVRVSDTGCGIRPEDRPRVFERFFQADPARSGDTRIRGTGLGLAIVKHACERLGARIAIDSEVGKGTNVTLTVPANADKR